MLVAAIRNRIDADHLGIEQVVFVSPLRGIVERRFHTIAHFAAENEILARKSRIDVLQWEFGNDHLAIAEVRNVHVENVGKPCDIEHRIGFRSDPEHERFRALEYGDVDMVI